MSDIDVEAVFLHPRLREVNYRLFLPEGERRHILINFARLHGVDLTLKLLRISLSKLNFENTASFREIQDTLGGNTSKFRQKLLQDIEYLDNQKHA